MFQLLLQYLLGDDDDMMFKEKERRIVKVNFCLQKQDRGARNFTIENGEKEERKKERKKRYSPRVARKVPCECRCSSQKT